MTEILCTRKIEFDAGHRVREHEHRCAFVHGHRYVAEFTFQAEQLDRLGRVVDFGVIKERLQNWIDDNWDHTCVLHEADSELGTFIAEFTGQKIFYLPYNPTAEQMALYLLEEICPKLFPEKSLRCVSVLLRETPNCSAEVRL
jgi:6-pyruvoyltetrahydropterin/6-carboxytetrahydropterin synthase